MKNLVRGLLLLLWLLVISSQVWGGTWTANGFIYKPALGARGASEKEAYDTGQDRIDARLGKQIYLGDPNYGDTLAAAITRISSSHVTLVVPPGTWVGDDVTVPSNLTLRVLNGATITVATTKTFTIDGPFQAGLYKVFSCSGTGKVVFGDGTVKEVYPEWWGENTIPGTTDMTAAINAACAAYSKVRLQPCNYKITGPIALVGNQVFIGAGTGLTKITAVRASATDSWNVLTNYNYLMAPSPWANQEITIKGISIYAGAGSLTGVSKNPHLNGYSQSWGANGICLTAAEGSLIEDCEVYDTGLFGILVNNTRRVTVRHCYCKDVGRISYVSGDVGQPWESIVAAANGISISSDTPITGNQALVDDCLVDTFRDVGINCWQVSDVKFIDCVVIGTAYPGVTSLSGAGIGFSNEGGGTSSTRTSFINCRHLDCAAAGFFIGDDATLLGCLVRGASFGAFTIGIKIVGNNVLVDGFKLRTQDTNYPYTGIIATSDAAASYLSNINIRNCDLENGATGGAIRLENVTNYVVQNNTIKCNSVAASYGIVLNAYSGGSAFSAKGVISANKISLAGMDAICAALNNDVFITENTILGAGNAAIEIYGCTAHIRRNVCRQYDGSHKIGYAVLFSSNPNGGDVWDNDFNDYINGVYGMNLTTTGASASVRFDATGKPEETINGALQAAVGSWIRTNHTGPAIWLWQNINGGTSWSGAAD